MAVSTLNRDQLNSVRAVFDSTGCKERHAVYAPYGAEEKSTAGSCEGSEETKGWIGERYDAGAGLQFLNARYYDPELGLFLQPDWFEVLQPGVGTNRYVYAMGDPVNKMDPGGNEVFGIPGYYDEGVVGVGIGIGALGIGLGLTLGKPGAIVSLPPTNIDPPRDISAADQALNNTVTKNDNPYGISSHGGKAGGDLPSTEDIFNGTIEENQDLIDFLTDSIEKRKEEYHENKHQLSQKARRGYRQKISNEEEKIAEAKRAIDLAEGWIEAAEKEAENDEEKGASKKQ